MEASKVFAKIKELGHVPGKREELRDYCQLKIDQVYHDQTKESEVCVTLHLQCFYLFPDTEVFTTANCK